MRKSSSAITKMNQIWSYSLLSVLIVSAISLVGILSLPFKPNKLRKVLIYLVSFAAGALLGDAFIHLLPDSFEKNGFGLVISISVLSGILIFFVLEKIIHWRHCHDPSCERHSKSFVYMNVFGDSIHNLIDGAIIAASYMVSLPVGVATTLAVILHEIPQEIGDFGVMLHGGFSRKKALFVNFLSALTAVVGCVITLLIAGYSEGIENILIPLAAGGFIYIAASDLIPELHKEVEIKKSLLQILFIILGIVVMSLLV
jgi:zinc and cadmium transporter